MAQNDKVHDLLLKDVEEDIYIYRVNIVYQDKRKL